MYSVRLALAVLFLFTAAPLRSESPVESLPGYRAGIGSGSRITIGVGTRLLSQSGEVTRGRLMAEAFDTGTVAATAVFTVLAVAVTGLALIPGGDPALPWVAGAFGGIRCGMALLNYYQKYVLLPAMPLFFLDGAGAWNEEGALKTPGHLIALPRTTQEKLKAVFRDRSAKFRISGKKRKLETLDGVTLIESHRYVNRYGERVSELADVVLHGRFRGAPADLNHWSLRVLLGPEAVTLGAAERNAVPESLRERFAPASDTTPVAPDAFH